MTAYCLKRDHDKGSDVEKEPNLYTLIYDPGFQPLSPSLMKLFL